MAWRGRAYGWLGLGVAAALVGASCGESRETVSPIVIGTSSSSGGGGGQGGAGGAGAGGAGGAGGEGGAPACEAGRDPCRTNPDPHAATACCAPGEQCCAAEAYGYSDGDRCKPADEPCPVGCPGGADVCPLGTYCKEDAETQRYGCEAECSAAALCGFNLCCPTGAGCESGKCPLPDITIDKARLAHSPYVEIQHFGPNACEIMEGCIGGPGDRTLLLFDTRTPNVGEGDLVLGRPNGNPLFQFSQCHQHFHFEGYSTYQLRDANGAVVAAGHKQAFCLEDLDPDSHPHPPSKFTCNNQGITAGWADVYSGGLPCQWIDVTGVPPGDYKLYVEINPDHILAESDYSNNAALVDVTIPFNSCPHHCRPVDEACCAPGDPCGWAADGSCDCGGYFGWDTADCASCPDFDCGQGNTCPAGCTPPDDPTCCVAGDPCGLADDGVCACGGTQPWDQADCAACTTQDPDCPEPPLTCMGCIDEGIGDQCCSEADLCNYAGDGWCDCGGRMSWDVDDCLLCTGMGPDCP